LKLPFSDAITKLAVSHDASFVAAVSGDALDTVRIIVSSRRSEQLKVCFLLGRGRGKGKRERGKGEGEEGKGEEGKGEGGNGKAKGKKGRGEGGREGEGENR
jgi:uncharacterized protein